MERDEPPPMTAEALEDEEDDDDSGLFKSTKVEPVKKESSEDEEASATTSGYATREEQENVPRSDTMEEIGISNSKDQKKSVLDMDDSDDDDLFKSAIVEPQPRSKREQQNGAIFSEPPTIAAADKEISLEDDDNDDQEAEEDAHPFKDAHLQPQLQLSGGGVMTNVDEIKPAPEISPFVGGGGSLGSNNDSSSSNSQLQKQSLLNADEKKELESGDDFIHVSVTSPHKVGEGMSSYLAYNCTTKTNCNYFKKKEMHVTRRFSDFLGLHDKLCEKYLQNGRIIPPAPDKSVVGMTKVKMSRENEQTVQEEFIERRRAALERFLNRTAAHPSLRTDPDFRDFLEQEVELPKSNQTATLSGRNVMKLISKVGDSFSSMTLKMEETDEWFEEKCHTIDQLDSQLRKLHMSTEALADYRKNLGQYTGSVSKSLAVLSGSEENSALSSAIAQLSNVEERIEHIHCDQSLADFYHLSELIKDHIGLVGAVKDVFHERVKAWQAWQGASANLTKKREAKVKAELQQKSDRVAVLRQEIADLECQQDMAHENFDRISRLIKKEVEMFDLRKAEDFKRNMIKYLEAMLKSQEQILQQWERYLPEVQQIRP